MEGVVKEKETARL
jgi:hypothetical protein